MATASSIDEYRQQKEIVIDEKKNGKVSPDKLYKLAALVARWKPNDHLPVCLLCRNLTKKPKRLGHIFPHSILKEAGRKTFFDYIRGAEGGVSNFGFYAFCNDCEKLFQQGEDYFNPKFFAPFYNNPAEEIEETVIQPDSNFPWLHYCLISIIWRTLCFVPLSDQYVKVLDFLRSYLLKWQTVKIDSNVKLFLFAPNNKIDQKIGNKQIEKRFFYETFHAIALETTSKLTFDPNCFAFWGFLGPLHVLMIYSEDNFKMLKDNEDFQEWEVCSMLSTQTKTFNIGEKAARVFPVCFYDQIVDRISYILSATSRLPSAGKDTNESSQGFEPSCLHLLPKDISYDSQNDKFTFNSDIFEVQGAATQPYRFVTIVCAKRGTEKVIFVVIKGALTSGGEVAIGLNLNDDGTVQYLKDVNIPTNTTMDLTEPPSKQCIEDLISDFDIQQAFE